MILHGKTVKVNARDTVRVSPMDTFTVTWSIEPTRFGQIPLKVSARVKDLQVGDTLVKHLKVKPNGIHKEIPFRQWLTKNRAFNAVFVFNQFGQ